MRDYIMSIDQGSSSSRCLIIDKAGKIVASAQKPIASYYPRSAWVEQDADEIFESVIAVCEQAMAELSLGGRDIAAIGIANQRETVVVWDKHTGRPLCRAISWQCRRTAEFMDELQEDGFADYIAEKTGLPLDAYFSASKIKWVLDNVPTARERAERGELLFGTVDTWLIWKLTDGKLHITDHTNASRTMLMNINTHEWQDYLFELFTIPTSMRPEIRHSSEVYGETRRFGFPVNIAAAAGDQQASLFGQGCFYKGDVKCTYGTGCFMLMNCGSEKPVSDEHLITTYAATRKDNINYALEGNVFMGGAVIDWLRDDLRMVAPDEDLDAIASSVGTTEGAYLVPAFTGLGAPWWSQDARGTIVGMSRGFDRARFVRTCLEGVAYRCRDVFDAMERDVKLKIEAVRVDGGASKSKFLMRFQSALLNCHLLLSESSESTAMGVAFLAGLAVRFWKSEEELKQFCAKVTPVFDYMDASTRKKLVNGWEHAVNTALHDTRPIEEEDLYRPDTLRGFEKEDGRIVVREVKNG